MPCLSSTATRGQPNAGEATLDFDLCSRSSDKSDDSATKPESGTPSSSIADSAHLSSGGTDEPPNRRRIMTAYMYRRRQRLQQLNEWHEKVLDNVTGSSDIDYCDDSAFWMIAMSSDSQAGRQVPAGCPPPPALESHPDDVYFRSFPVLTDQVLESFGRQEEETREIPYSTKGTTLRASAGPPPYKKGGDGSPL